MSGDLERASSVELDRQRAANVEAIRRAGGWFADPRPTRHTAVLQPKPAVPLISWAALFIALAGAMTGVLALATLLDAFTLGALCGAAACAAGLAVFGIYDHMKGHRK